MIDINDDIFPAVSNGGTSFHLHACSMKVYQVRSSYTDDSITFVKLLEEII